MKKLMKRSLAFTIALVMCLSMCSAFIISVGASSNTVDYKYSGSYIYNWGEREEVATFLSPNAILFYSKYNITYAEMQRKAIKKALDGERVTRFDPKENLMLDGDRIISNLPFYAYLKIADGCDNRCTYCAIPMIRGSFRSRKIENIVDEAKKLVKNGVRELNVVAQDTTRYGEDIYGRPMLCELLDELCKACGVKHLQIVDAYDVVAVEKAVKAGLASKEVSVIIAQRPCVLLKNVVRKKVSVDACKKCGKCMKLGCPAISIVDGQTVIDPTQCNGCGLCMSWCKFDAIKREEN